MIKRGHPAQRRRSVPDSLNEGLREEMPGGTVLPWNTAKAIVPNVPKSLLTKLAVLRDSPRRPVSLTGVRDEVCGESRQLLHSGHPIHLFRTTPPIQGLFEHSATPQTRPTLNALTRSRSCGNEIRFVHPRTARRAGPAFRKTCAVRLCLYCAANGRRALRRGRKTPAAMGSPKRVDVGLSMETRR